MSELANQVSSILQDKSQVIPTMTSDSTLRIRQIFPSLEYVKEEIIYLSYAHLLAIVAHNMECQNCHKTMADMAECYKEYVTSFDGQIIFSSGPCPKRARQSKYQRIEGLLKKSRLSKRFLERRFDTFVVTDQTRLAYQVCKSYAEGMPHDTGLLLTGPTGTGKTHLAVAILQVALEKGYSGLFVTVPELLDSIKNSFAPGADREELFDAAKDAEILVLDDIGVEKVTDFVAEKIFTLINSRYEDMLPTIVTSNLTMKELADRLGSRVVSRLCEMTTGALLGGSDYRLKRA